MTIAAKNTSIISTKGQIVLPKAIRDRRGWQPGTRVIIEDTDQGIVLRPQSPFPQTRPEDVFGMLKYDGPPVTIEEMDEAIAELFRREHDRD